MVEFMALVECLPSRHMTLNKSWIGVGAFAPDQCWRLYLYQSNTDWHGAVLDWLQSPVTKYFSYNPA